MSETNFKPVFDYIDQSKRELKEDLLGEIASKKAVEKLQDSVVGLAKRFDKIEQESIVTKARTQRVEHWVMEASSKIKVAYKP